jgi:hypothetical protein
MLDVLNKELVRRGHRFVRYADDGNVYVRSRRAGDRVMTSVTQFVTSRLKLRGNAAKSAVDQPSRRKFLGFSFTTGKAPSRRRIAPQALARFKARVRELTRRTKGVSLEQGIESLRTYLTGWVGYFGFCQTPSVLRGLDQWVRRPLRAIAWIQWRNGWNRFRQLFKRHVPRRLAAQTAASAHGPWRIAASPALNIALSNATLPRSAYPCWLQWLLNPANRRVRTRMHGGVGGAAPRGAPLSRSQGPPPAGGAGEPCWAAKAARGWFRHCGYPAPNRPGNHSGRCQSRSRGRAGPADWLIEGISAAAWPTCSRVTT